MDFLVGGCKKMKNIAFNLTNRIDKKIKEPIGEKIPIGSYHGGGFSEAECLIHQEIRVAINIQFFAEVIHNIYQSRRKTFV